MVHPWPLKTSRLNTASFHFFLNGPAFFDFFLHLSFLLHEVSSYQVPAEVSLAHQLGSAQPERARSVHPWPLKTSQSNTASFHCLRSGPDFFEFFLHLFFCVARRLYQVPVELSLVRQLSSAQQRTAVLALQRSAVRCHAVRHCAMLCRAVPCCVLRCTLYLVRAKYYSKYHAKYRYCYTRLVRTSFLNHKNALPAQLRPAIAQQRSACGAVPCPAMRCGAVLPSSAVLYSNIKYRVLCEVPSTRYWYVRVY